MLEVMVKLLMLWLGSLLIACILSLIVALPVSLLWNWLLPTMSTMPEISYLQAVGLVLLIHLISRGAKSSIKFKA